MLLVHLGASVCFGVFFYLFAAEYNKQTAFLLYTNDHERILLLVAGSLHLHSLLHFCIINKHCPVCSCRRMGERQQRLGGVLVFLFTMCYLFAWLKSVQLYFCLTLFLSLFCLSLCVCLFACFLVCPRLLLVLLFCCFISISFISLLCFSSSPVLSFYLISHYFLSFLFDFCLPFVTLSALRSPKRSNWDGRL